MILKEYFDRIAIIHLRERTDRYATLKRELRLLSIDITDQKVSIPEAPMPPEANGFASKGVYGSFLSHLDILKTARADGLRNVWILEDDAIFSKRFSRDQKEIVEFLDTNPWDICYFGHTLTHELKLLEQGFPRYSGPFYWAHCYAVHHRVLDKLIEYLEQTLQRPHGDPLGGKLYIDAAYTLFRKFNPDVFVRVANPVLSVQRGSPSSLAKPRWYDKIGLTQSLANAARSARDECWRRTGLTFGGAAPRDLGN
jgi:glycosyl transferase, family 25